jgi:hypothetical protein
MYTECRGLRLFRALPQNEKALPQNEKALPQNEKALPQNEKALPQNENLTLPLLQPKKINRKNRTFS